MKRVNLFVNQYCLLLALSLFSTNFTKVQASDIQPKNQVIYKSFEGSLINSSVLLKWLTAEEINNSHFEIERSFDHKNFKTVGLALDGFIKNTTDKSYMFKDLSADVRNKQVIYYRLKQIDNDGTAAYSNVITIINRTENEIAGIWVSPNPFQDNIAFQIQATDNGSADINLLNTNGKTVVSKQSILKKGDNNIQFEGLGNLNPGVYVVQVIMNGTIIRSQKVIKN